MTFLDFVLERLPRAPARVLEIGCGDEGGVTPALADAGYDVLGVDPRAPEGPLFRRVRLEELDGGERFDAVVAGRVLHHVDPLGPALDRLAAHAPLLLVDEFAWEEMDRTTGAWYERRRRELADAGASPGGPAGIPEWRDAHPGLHPSDLLLAELRSRYRQTELERLPFFHRWLGDPATEALEAREIAAGRIRAIGLRWAGAAAACVQEERSAP